MQDQNTSKKTNITMIPEEIMVKNILQKIGLPSIYSINSVNTFFKNTISKHINFISKNIFENQMCSLKILPKSHNTDEKIKLLLEIKKGLGDIKNKSQFEEYCDKIIEKDFIGSSPGHEKLQKFIHEILDEKVGEAIMGIYKSLPDDPAQKGCYAPKFFKQVADYDGYGLIDVPLEHYYKSHLKTMR